MGLEAGFRWSYKDIRLIGYSLAGTSTSFVFPAASVAIDLGQGLPFQLKANNFLITHAHMDHASGIPYIICQKNMIQRVSPKLYMPKYLAEGMEEILGVWTKMENHRYDYQIIPVELHKSYPLKNNYSFRSFETFHRIPSFGYTIFQRKKQLRRDLQGLSSEEIKAFKQRGQPVDEFIEVPEFTYTGDTKSEVFTGAPSWALNSRVFAVEVSFIGKHRSVENSRKWGSYSLG